MTEQTTEPIGRDANDPAGVLASEPTSEPASHPASEPTSEPGPGHVTGPASGPNGVWQLPPSPIADFNALREQLRNQLAEAKEAHARSEETKVQQRLQWLEETEMALEQARRQQLTLQQYEHEFEGLGDFGAQGSATVAEHLEKLGGYVSLLEETLVRDELVQARELRQNQSQTLSDELAAILTRGDTSYDREQVASSLLKLTRAVGHERAMELMHRFETELGFLECLSGMRAAQRFWLDIAKSQTVQDSEASERARQRHRELQAELTRREAESQATGEVSKLCTEIRQGVDYLDQLGTQERIVQINVWAGKLRLYQDGFDLPPEIETQIHYAFGALNSSRKRLMVDAYIEPLNRDISHDWGSFVKRWDDEREAARQQDQAREEEIAQQRQQEAHRLILAEKRAEQAERNLEALEALLAGGDPRTNPESLEDFHNLVADVLENDGCRLDRFIDLMAPHADLVASGGEYRSLRRSLKKRDLWPDDVEPFVPADPQRGQGMRDALVADLAPVLGGKRLLILGGKPRPEMQEVLTEKLGLAEVAWPDGWDHQLDLATISRSIRGGKHDLAVMLVRFAGHNTGNLREDCQAAGVPWVMLDKGCGLLGILRAIREQALGSLRAGA